MRFLLPVREKLATIPSSHIYNRIIFVSDVNTLQTNAVVDKVVQFLVQEKKIDTGLNAVFTSLSNVRPIRYYMYIDFTFYYNFRIIVLQSLDFLRNNYSGEDICITRRKRDDIL